MMKNLLLACSLLCLSLSGCTQDIKSGRLIFYNTENFFDTIKDPKNYDGEYTPTGKDKWTSDRYHHKLQNIAKVLAAMSKPEAPIAIGLAEIENKHVSEDLAAEPALSKYDLGVIEQDSPDPRGIDVALLYNKKLFTVTATEFLTVRLPGSEIGTRDILYVKGTVKGAVLHLFVNHWPSRRDGKEASEPKRLAAAAVLHQKVASITAAEPDAGIVIMGDLNDNPTDTTITVGLGASAPVEPYSHSHLYDLMTKLYQDGKYTLRYHEEKDIFDQMIVSGMLIDKASAVHIKNNTGGIFKENWMLFSHPKWGEMPNRTYSGPMYHGGYSDHLPVYLDLIFGK